MREKLESAERVLEIAKSYRGTKGIETPCIVMDPSSGSLRATFHFYAWPNKVLLFDLDRSVFQELRDTGHLEMDLDKREAVRYAERMQAWPIKIKVD